MGNRRHITTAKSVNPLCISREEWANIIQALGLSPRESDIVALILRGLGDKEIAGELAMSVNTLRTHLRHVFLRLAITSRLELVMRVFALLRTRITENG
jgi:DNA-binding CsgD family transcriptional regulator